MVVLFTSESHFAFLFCQLLATLVHTIYTLEIDCNRTYTGTVGIKYPLYLKEPLQKFAAFNCQVTFSALGQNHGDIVELTILSFQVGYFPITKKPSAFVIDKNLIEKCGKKETKFFDPKTWKFLLETLMAANKATS
uniref:Uncharacterized protein n=1 Tax=Tetranychus urticae TaxID=32264 RepID=T1KK99_TETUR